MGEYTIPIGIAVIFTIVFYGVIIVHDIPYQIAKSRNHPHQDAIHIAGWVSLLFLGVIWPFLWIWAALYREDRGWGIAVARPTNEATAMAERIAKLSQRVTDLESELGVATPKSPSGQDDTGAVD